MRLLKEFENRTMGFKFTMAFLSVIMVPMVLLAYISYRVIDYRLLNEAQEKIDIGLKAAWTEYYVRGEQMRYGMLQAASMEEIKNAVKSGNKPYLKKMMTAWKRMRPYVDIWAVTDADGKVIARLNSDYNGDVMSLGGFVASAIASREPRISTEVLEKEMLRLEGGALAENRFGAPEKSSAMPGQGDVMALTVVTPVLDDEQRPVGSIITADVLNNDDYISETLASKIPGLFTSVAVKGFRISTNLIDNGGRSLRNSAIPAHFKDKLESEPYAMGEWTASGMSYISAFESIKNHKGEVIGSLDAGIQKNSLWAIQKENQKVIAWIALLGISASLMIAFVSTAKITKPLRVLKEKIGAFAGGDLGARVEVDEDFTKDEIKMLARAFNSMMEEVSRRDSEKQRYLTEIEHKNSKMAGLNQEMKKTNEELELAYEETQSQTEELHAINEELRLLNEDLDRKNAELKRANRIITQEEQELKRAKDKLRLIYDSIRDYVLLVGYDLNILEANKYLFDELSLNEALVLGKNIYALFGLEASQTNCPVRKAIDSMRPVMSEMTTAEGNVLTWHVYPLVDEKDEARKAVVYIRDITEQRMLSHKLIQSDKLSSLGELVSGVAHELNNPLTGIMCFSELLMDDSLRPDINSKLRKINDASQRCKRIIDNLLTFARWKRPEKTCQDINKVIRDCAELRAYQLKVDNIELELDLDDSVPKTMLDESQIHQVLLNLINNASDAIKEKDESGGKIKVTSRHAWDKLVVKVEDTGKGMPDDVVNRIFDPFFTTKGVGKGTGLGLSISYGIINEHGGNIYASSKLGSGTVFVLELPVVEKNEEAPADTVERWGEESRTQPKVSGLKALVLDDEPILLELLNESLSNAGFQVESTSSGEEALDKLGKSDFDVIISDIKMPGLDGKGFYREVKKLKPEAVKRIIFISGDSINRETQEFLKESGNLSLKKPFTVDQLNGLISRLLTEDRKAKLK